LSKFGPVIQYKPHQNAEQDKYIDIKAYLKYTNKSYTNVSKEDVVFLTNLPRKIATINGHDLILTAGPYGLYFKYNDENVKIPLKMIKRLLDPEESISIPELDSVIQFHKNKKQADKVKKIERKEVKSEKKKTNKPYLTRKEKQQSTNNTKT
jgi:hypothetical protein